MSDTTAIVVAGWFLTLLSEKKFLEKVQVAIPQFESWLLYKSGDSKALAKKVIKSGARLV